MLTIKLILYDIVENFQQVEDQVVVGGLSKEKPRSGKRFHKVKKASTCDHRKTLQVRRDCNYGVSHTTKLMCMRLGQTIDENSEKTIVEWLETR